MQVTENPDGTVTMSKESLETLLKTNEELKADITVFRKCIMKFCGILGVTTPDGNNIKPEIARGEESVFANILKSAGDIITLFASLSVPVIGKRSEAKIKEKFSFFEEGLPLIEKYGKQN